ncbi:5-(carboxyamino)imidazole ribonucleotide synthase [Altererythrobacter aurantiacus]|uniref:N5-carboxyaminoimidazole ribonucleotide synthase n=1 Tax=Parapontixanthobacter aurantiacus TaxID=1463599 RepID=A0A844ZIE0_9SPHN|nr:5-(carboxyamino)imidazole ribonucleotide synthase [Parapontixanthobacter aurantiacus]MXO86740.1 5-(carboxyamino)imidazole ribonucleotide synthase [Parapontixanthobacter aurantiacus]
MLAVGSTIGILGGGQLGRMLAVPATQFGYRVVTYSPEADSVAAELSADWIAKPWDDAEAMADFAARCDVVTWEFENVPTAPLNAIADKLVTPVRALEVAQDRLLEKQFVEELGGRPAPYVALEEHDDLRGALERIGTPGIVKTRRDGYDGKGQWRIDAGTSLSSLNLPMDPLIYEGFVVFEAEFSVILVRGKDGEVRFYDSAANEHRSGILARSTLPPPAAIAGQIDEARALARKIADALQYVGVLTLEFFATADGPVFNEMAPRVHNSGHWSIEGAVASQFENHIRAICGLPLGDTALTAARIVMDNIIGDGFADATSCLGTRDCHLHLYGKSEAREGRKMGHVTRLERNGAGA